MTTIVEKPKTEIVKKVQDAAMDMLTKVTRDRYHRYTDADGRFLAGASSVSGVKPQSEVGFLAPWGGKEAVKALGYYDRIKDHDHEPDIANAATIWNKIKELKDVGEYLKLLANAKGGAKRKSETAIDIGKEGHAWLEQYVKSRIRGEEVPSLDKWEAHPFIHNAFIEFAEWERENIKQWILSEALVFRLDNPLASEWESPDHLKGYAGQLDALAETKKGLTVIDFKFSSRISVDYFLQTAGYAAAFWPYDLSVKNRAILRFPKTEHRQEWNTKERIYENVRDEFEIAEGNPERIDWDFATFLHQREVLRWFNQVSK